jgi:putative ABC transport system permease protein
MYKQLTAAISMSLQTLPQRIGASSVIVIGIAGVVAVLVSVLAMGAGFRHTLADSGRPDRVIILRGGSDAELNSSLTRSDIDTISNAPGLATDSAGKAVLSDELVTVVNIPKVDTGTDANITLRGRRPESLRSASRVEDPRRPHVSSGRERIDCGRRCRQAIPRAHRR